MKLNIQNINSISEELKKAKDLLDGRIVNTEEYEKIKTSIITKFENAATEELLAENEHGVVTINESNLTDTEKQKIEILKAKMDPGEVIAKHQVNKKIEILSNKSYKEWIRLYGEDIMTLIAKKE